MSQNQQSIIPFLCPASEQSNNQYVSLQKVRDYVDESKFLTNWLKVAHDGWKLIATAEQHDWCGLWQTRGCLNSELHHKLGKGRRVYVKQFQRSCYRPACKTCYPKWIARQAKVSTERIEEYGKNTSRKPIHLLLSVNPNQYWLSQKELKKRIKKILEIIEFEGGAIVFHPFKFRKSTRTWYHAPHFHIVGFGCRSFIFKGYGKFGWLVKDMGIRESVFQTFCYLLSHCGIKKRVHTVSWLGNLSYSKLKVEKEPIVKGCPICGGEFMPIYYDGIHPVVPPDTNYEGLVDDYGGWYPVKTESELDPVNYDYHPIRKVNDILRSIA